MRVREGTWLALLIAVIAAFIVILENVEIPYDTFFWRAVQNAGHTPFFGLMALMLLAVSTLTLGRYVSNRWLHYALAFGTAVIIGAASEYAQIDGPRDADIWDLIRDVIGAAIFLAVYLVFDRNMAPAWNRWGIRVRKLIIFVSVLLVMAVWVPVAVWAGAFLHRGSAMPQLAGFDSVWDRLFLAVSDARLSLVAPPTNWVDNRSDNVARVTFETYVYPTFYLEEPFPDWSGYRYLSFWVYSENPDEVRLVVTVEDYHHNLMYSDRFNRAFGVVPGLNRITISLDDIRNAPAGRTMDMTAIRAIHLFTPGIMEPVVLYFDDFRLEE